MTSLAFRDIPMQMQKIYSPGFTVSKFRYSFAHFNMQFDANYKVYLTKVSFIEGRSPRVLLSYSSVCCTVIMKKWHSQLEELTHNNLHTN